MRGISGRKDEAGIFLELLAERLAGEVITVGLLDALARRREAVDNLEFSMNTIDLLRGQELAHVRLLERGIRILGGSLNAPSPRARRLELCSEGLRRVLREGTGGFAGALEAVLFAVLREEAGWEALLPLAGACLNTLAWDFRGALLEEQEHVRVLREWLALATAGEARRLA